MKRKAWRDAKRDYIYEEAAARKASTARKIGWGLFWAAIFTGVLNKLLY